MIVYQATKKDFLGEVFANEVHDIIKINYLARTGHKVSPQEFKSWEDSMRYSVSCDAPFETVTD